jgi:hypothetical protein
MKQKIEGGKKKDKCPKCGASDWKDTTNIAMLIGTWNKHRECRKCGLKQIGSIFGK